MGVIPTLVKLLGIHCHNAALTEMCLVAFGNLAELGKSASQATRFINLLMLLQWLLLYELGIHWFQVFLSIQGIFFNAKK